MASYINFIYMGAACVTDSPPSVEGIRGETTRTEERERKRGTLALVEMEGKDKVGRASDPSANTWRLFVNPLTVNRRSRGSPFALLLSDLHLPRPHSCTLSLSLSLNVHVGR